MFSSENIFLRPILKTDLVYLNKWKNTKEIYQYLGGGFSPISINQQEKWLENMIDITDKNKRYMICNMERYINGTYQNLLLMEKFIDRR
ncbi:hypothetical protein [Aerococcus sp. HMSC10H05]|uniref:hypothetical protein n=1 Tax=Aerococcus sp. HMSC10H05 TaxID=1581084 RepID=UPI0008A34121|nr:hypothetical protein [Aerococcus sp. HMSC10H05]OFU49972.1 hypothetical protein HMPREF3116_06180 [Aerococcus sp. HMSC10H05]